MNTETVIINDVGPRDGLQNQPKHLSVEERLRLIRAVEAAGVRDIEVGSFVSPKAVPAMAGTDQIMAGLDTTSGQNYSALIPNMKGYELARNAGTPTVAMVLYASEGMAQKNVNMSLQQAEAVTLDILERAREENVRIIATIAVAFECPFDGPTDPARVEDIAARFVDAGVEQIVIADTIGAGNPQQVSRLTRKLVDTNGADRVACHFHDTRAMGLANVFAAIPSLHSAYPIIPLYFAIKRKMKYATWVFFVICVGIWGTAVYSRHHYIIDVILGSFCAIIAIFVFDFILMKTKIRTLIDKYAAFIA